MGNILRPEGSPTILPTMSMLAAIKEEKHMIKARTAEVEGKISALSVKESRRPLLRLLVEKAELKQRREELKRDKLRLRSEAELKAAEKRIVQARGELWAQKIAQWKREEKINRLKGQSPRSNAPHDQILCHLYMEQKWSPKQSPDMWTMSWSACFAAYNVDQKSGNREDMRWCVLAGRFFRRRMVEVACIVPIVENEAIVECLFGKTAILSFQGAGNGLPLCRMARQAFERGDFALVPQNSWDSQPREWQVIVINESKRFRKIPFNDTAFVSLTVAECEGRRISFRSEQRPASNFLYYHFVRSLLRLRQHLEPHWKETWARFSELRPFARPEAYVRKSMLMALAKGYMSISEAELDHLLGEPSIVCGPQIDDSNMEEPLQPKEISPVAENDSDEGDKSEDRDDLFEIIYKENAEP